MSPADYEKMRAGWYNQTQGRLHDGIDCPDCLNRGNFMEVDDKGRSFLVPCQCMGRREALRRHRNSGLGELLERYTFPAWQVREDWQEAALEMAQDYAREPSGWLFLSGGPGTGKTHLCTAVCGQLMDDGKQVRYVLWRELTVRAKALVQDDLAYRRVVDPLKRAEVLYLDDLFKTGRGEKPTVADVNLAFDLLNVRYNSGLPTLLSSEWSVKDLVDIDEALGSRIFERSREYYMDLTGGQNWRLRPAP